MNKEAAAHALTISYEQQRPACLMWGLFNDHVFSVVYEDLNCARLTITPCSTHLVSAPLEMSWTGCT